MCDERAPGPGANAGPGVESVSRTGYPRHMEALDVVAEIASVIAACAGLVAAIGVLVVNGKVDRLTGRVDELSRAFNSHVNASH